MEDELERWNNEVAEAREKFYELNYFTTRQLLILRSELGRLKCGQPLRPKLQLQVIALLKSVTSAITPSALTTHLVQNLPREYLTVNKDRKAMSYSDRAEQPVEAMSLPRCIPLSPSSVNTKPVVEGLPKVSLEDLTDVQKQYVTEVIETYDYSEMTALKAIEAVGDGDMNDIDNWLSENGDKWEKLFQEAHMTIDNSMTDKDLLVESDVEENEEICDTEDYLQLQQSSMLSECVVYIQLCFSCTY